MRRAFQRLKNGRPGPVMVEIPADIAESDSSELIHQNYVPSSTYRSGADENDVLKAAELLLSSEFPVIYAGQGVIYGDACEELAELAELTKIAVTTTMAGKGAIDERHELALGSSSVVMNGAVLNYMQRSDTPVSYTHLTLPTICSV